MLVKTELVKCGARKLKNLGIHPQFTDLIRTFSNTNRIYNDNDLNTTRDNLKTQIDPSPYETRIEYEAEKKPASRKILSGFRSLIDGKGTPQIADPSFEQIGSENGPLIVTRLPAYSRFTLVRGNVVGKSPAPQIYRTTNGFITNSIFHTVFGRKMFISNILTNEQSGDVLISPNTHGGMSSIKLNGFTQYYIKKNCVMAYTSLITIKSVLGLASNLGSGFLKFDKVSGNGTVVFASRGGLHRLSLSENEEYLVNSKHVVAWDSNVNIKRDEDEPVVRKLWKYGQFDKTASSVGSPTQKQEQESKVATKKPYLQRITEYFKTRATRLLTFIKNGSLASVQYLSVYLWDLLKLYLWRTRRYIRNGFNSTVFFRVCGPGDVYLTSTTTKSIYDSVSQRLTSSK